VLLKYQEKIEAHLFAPVRDLFALQTTITLYDLTNTDFEGKVGANGKARRGHSKERRTGCPLLTLALVLDDSGFVIRSKVMAGNAVECRTLEGMLKDLDAPPGAWVVMDRGIATEVNLAWLRERGYRTRVVSRERERRMAEAELRITTAGGEALWVEKVVDEASGEVRLICHSPLREEKKGMV
jgi:transposase